MRDTSSHHSEKTKRHRHNHHSSSNSNRVSHWHGHYSKNVMKPSCVLHSGNSMETNHVHCWEHGKWHRHGDHSERDTEQWHSHCSEKGRGQSRFCCSENSRRPSHAHYEKIRFYEESYFGFVLFFPPPHVVRAGEQERIGVMQGWAFIFCVKAKNFTVN